MNFWFELQLLPTFSDYSTLQSKIQSISNGGSINFQYTFGDKNCNSICKSNHVQIGCKYGFRCKVGSRCQSVGNCVCDLQMSCNEKFQPRFRGLRNGAKSGFRNGAKSTPDLGLVKTSISMILETCIEQIVICLLFRLFNFENKNSRDSKWRVY